MATYCPDLSGDFAALVVSQGHTTFTNLATHTYDLAIEQANALADFVATPYAFNVDYNFNGQLTPFQRPIAPTLNLGDYNLNAPSQPGLPENYIPGTITFEPMPDSGDLTPPTFQFGDRPLAPDIEAPTAPVRNLDLVVPAAPDYVLPPVPTMIELNLPSAPAINLPIFDSVKPVFNAPDLDENWSFDPAPYVSDLMDLMKAKCSQLIDGDVALPPQIEDAMFARGRSKVESAGAVEIEQIYDEFSSRGFTVPQGILLQRLDQARQRTQNLVADFAREVTIKAFEEALANMRLALQIGVSLEGVATNLHIEEQKLALQAAQFTRETAIAILNARVSVFNAQLNAYSTDAEVFKARIQAALATVEVYRAQIEGEKARGEINEQSVRIYAEQIRAISTMADFYRSTIEGVKAQADIERAIIESYRAQVQAYGTRWEAYGQEWGAYKAAVDAENSKASIHRNLVDAFATRVQATASQNNSFIDRERLFIQQHQQKLNVYGAQLEQVKSLLDAERTRLQAVASRDSAQAQIYTSSASVEQAASASTDRSFELGLENARAEVDTQLKEAEIKVQENIQITQLMLEVRKMLTQVMSQLASSSMAAVNYSANVGSSKSSSIGCSTSFSFSGEIADAG